MDPKEQKSDNTKSKNEPIKKILTLAEISKIKSYFDYTFSITNITPYDGTISSSKLQLSQTEHPNESTYKEIIKKENSKNKLIQFFIAYNKSNKFKREIDKESKKTNPQYEKIFNSYKVPFIEQEKIYEYIRDICTPPLQLVHNVHYYFYAFVLSSEIINTIASMHVFSSAILFGSHLQNFINTRVLQGLYGSMNEKEQNKLINDFGKPEHLNDIAYKHVITGDELEVIRVFHENPELLQNDPLAKLDSTIRFGRDKVVKYIIDSIDLSRIDNDAYIGFFNSAMQAIIRGHPAICLEFISPRIWNVFNESEQVLLLSLIALRSGKATREVLIDNLIENGLLNYPILLQVFSNNNLSNEKLEEIITAFSNYHEIMLEDMLTTVLKNTQENSTNIVLQISGVVALTKHFSIESKQAAVKKFYDKLEPLIERIKIESSKLDKKTSKHHHDFLKYILAEQASQKAIELASSLAVATNKSIMPDEKAKKDIDGQEASPNDDHPDDDQGGDEAEKIPSTSPIIGIVIKTDEELIPADLAEKLVSAEPIQVTQVEEMQLQPESQSLQKSWADIVRENSLKQDEEEEVISADLPENLVSVEPAQTAQTEEMQIQPKSQSSQKSWADIVKENSITQPDITTELQNRDNHAQEKSIPEEIKNDAEKEVESKQEEITPKVIIINKKLFKSTTPQASQVGVDLGKYSLAQYPKIEFGSFVDDEEELPEDKMLQQSSGSLKSDKKSSESITFQHSQRGFNLEEYDLDQHPKIKFGSFVEDEEEFSENDGSQEEYNSRSSSNIEGISPILSRSVDSSSETESLFANGNLLREFDGSAIQSEYSDDSQKDTEESDEEDTLETQTEESNVSESESLSDAANPRKGEKAKLEGESSSSAVNSQEAARVNPENAIIPKPAYYKPSAFFMNLTYFNPYFGWQQSHLKTQWLHTDAGKCIYSLTITNPNSSINHYLIDPATRNIANLSREEYNSLQPSVLSTQNHKLFPYFNNMFLIVEADPIGRNIFQYTITPMAEPKLANIVVNLIPIEPIASSDNTANQSVDAASGANQEASSSSTQAQQQTEQGRQHASSAQNNLSNEDQQNKTQILTSFKETETKFVEVYIPTTIALDKGISNVPEDQEEYKASMEAVEKRVEEQYFIRIKVEDSSEKVNVTYHDSNLEIASELLKPLLGEHDFGFKFFAGHSAL